MQDAAVAVVLDVHVGVEAGGRAEVDRGAVLALRVHVHDRARTQPARDPATEHEVEVVLAESGVTVTVGPETSILQAILDAGIDHDHDCTEGICGTCETKVIEGEVDHRDYVLTQREKDAGDCMMVCVSRACGKRLVLGI